MVSSVESWFHIARMERSYLASELQYVQAVTDADIFVFALNLEYMEADFYAWAAHVRPYPSSATAPLSR